MTTTPPAHSTGVRPLGCLLLVGIAVAILGVLIWAASRQEAARVATDPLIGQVRTVRPARVGIDDRRDGVPTVRIVDGIQAGHGGRLFGERCLGA